MPRKQIVSALAGRCALYFIADPRSPRRPRYVGLTGNPDSRAQSHAKLRAGSFALRAWKDELAAVGLVPQLTVLQWFPSIEEGRAAEWRTIHRWKRRGLCDLNSTRDGRIDAFALKWGAIRRRERTA